MQLCFLPCKKENKLDREKELKKLLNGYGEELKVLEIKIRKAKIERRRIKAKRNLENAVIKGKRYNKWKKK